MTPKCYPRHNSSNFLAIFVCVLLTIKPVTTPISNVYASTFTKLSYFVFTGYYYRTGYPGRATKLLSPAGKR